MRIHILALLILGSLSSPGTRADNLPNLGDDSQKLLSPQQEQSIGAGALRYLRLSPQWQGDVEVNDYLNRVVSRIVSANSEIKQSFTVVGLQDDSINAFAIPGGVIGVNSGLVMASQNESELAGVFSHEMAHVTQHHVSRLMEAQKRAMWPTLATMAAALLMARSNSDLALAGLTSSQAYNIQNTLDFTRLHEREADRIGMRYLQQSGFDPHGMPDFFQRLQQQTRFVESNAPGYLRTHPITQDRIADSEARLTELPYRQYPDSLDYLLIKEKIRVLSQSPERLKDEYDSRMHGNSGRALGIARYGLARLYLKERNTRRAWELAEPLLDSLPHPMVQLLAAEIQLVRQQPEVAEKLLNAGLERYPDSAALRQLRIQLLIKSRRGTDALEAIQDYQTRFPDTIDTWEWQANAYNQLGQEAESHLALGEFYWRLGANGDAIRQLRIAKEQPKLDSYVAARIASRLKEMQSQAREQDRGK